MNKNQHIPQGYKSSPLGIIPEDWELKRLGEVCIFLDAQRIPIKDADRGKMRGKYPYYGASGIIDYVNDYLFDDDLILLGEDGANIINRSTPLAFLVSGKIWVNNHAHVLKPKDKYNRYFICNYLETLSYDKYNTGTAQPKLNREICENIPILLPKKIEQNKIAEILQLWDTAIAKQTQLVEKLTLRKRGLMQQLLTGKKRLKGFEGEWKRILIKNFAKEVSIRNSNCKDYIVLSCTKYDGLVPSLEYFGKKIYSDDLSSYKIIPNGYFAYATNHIEEGSIGYQSKYEYGLISPMYTVFITDRKRVDDTFLFAVFKSHHLIHLYQSMMEGSINRRGGLRWDSFSTIKIYLPPLAEQNAIASVLIQADKEIELANKKLSQLQAQKRGLMQVLLTGKKRVK